MIWTLNFTFEACCMIRYICLSSAAVSVENSESVVIVEEDSDDVSDEVLNKLSSRFKTPEIGGHGQEFGCCIWGTTDTDSDKLNSLVSDSDTLPCSLEDFFVLVYSIKFNQSGTIEGPHKGYIPSKKSLLRNRSRDSTRIWGWTTYSCNYFYDMDQICLKSWSNRELHR